MKYGSKVNRSPPTNRNLMQCSYSVNTLPTIEFLFIDRPNNVYLVKRGMRTNIRAENVWYTKHTNIGTLSIAALTNSLINLRHIMPCYHETFDIHMSVHRKHNSKLQPTRCNVSWFIYFYRRSTCYRQFLRPSSGAHNCADTFVYCQPILLLAA